MALIFKCRVVFFQVANPLPHEIIKLERKLRVVVPESAFKQMMVLSFHTGD